MDIICIQCGAKLLPTNARYCNNCGALVSSKPLSTPSSDARDGASSPITGEPQYSSRPPLREQIAQQPPARPLQHFAPNEPPAWMSRLESGMQSRTWPNPPRVKRTIEGANEQGQENVQASPQQDVADKPTQASLSAADRVDPARSLAQRPVPPPPTAAAREPGVKVWPREEAALADMPQPAAVPQTEDGKQSVENTVEDLPTRPLAASAKPVPPVQRVVSPPPASKRRESTTDDIEQLHTAPLAAQQSMAPVSPANQSTTYSRPMEQQSWPGISQSTMDSLSFPPSPMSQPITPFSRPAVQSEPAQQYTRGPVSQVPPALPMQGHVPSPLSPLPPVASAQERTHTPPAAPSITVGRDAKKGNRRALLMTGLVVLAVLVIGSLGAWIAVRQPFTVPATTQPQQAFSNTRLGISVLYPSGWTTKVDQAKYSVYFADSSHTGQVTIMVAATSGDVGQYLSQEATHLGLTAVKQGTPLSFAGASWQEIQGNVQQAGASYATVLFATAHGGHIYTIIQMAPQSVYSQEDQLSFSPMRSSFRFLS